MLDPGPYKHPPQQLFSSKLDTTEGQVVTRVSLHLRLSPLFAVIGHTRSTPWFGSSGPGTPPLRANAGAAITATIAATTNATVNTKRMRLI